MAYAKTEKQIAELICTADCFCGYNCGRPNKAPAAIQLPLIGKGTECPLAKYGIMPEHRKRMELADIADKRKILTVDDCWNFCSEACDHAVVEGDGTIRLKDYDEVCLDCPVNAARENLQEQAAEAQMS